MDPYRDDLPDNRHSVVGAGDEGEQITLLRAISKKFYRCPHCRGPIEVGEDHVIVRYSHPARPIRHAHWHRSCAQEHLLLRLRQVRVVPAEGGAGPLPRSRGGRRSRR